MHNPAAVSATVAVQMRGCVMYSARSGLHWLTSLQQQQGKHLTVNGLPSRNSTFYQYATLDIIVCHGYPEYTLYFIEVVLNETSKLAHF